MTILSSDPLAYPLSRPSHGGPRIRCDARRGTCCDTPDPTRSARDAAHRATAAAGGHIGIPVNNAGIDAFGPARAYRSGHGHDLDAMAAQSPLGHVARPEEVASALAYPASDEASRITGAVLDADGGRAAV